MNFVSDNRTHQEIKRKLTLIREAIESWEVGDLTDIAAIIVIKRIATPKIPSPECTRWAMLATGAIEKHRKRE